MSRDMVALVDEANDRDRAIINNLKKDEVGIEGNPDFEPRHGIEFESHERIRRKVGEMSSGAATELWKPEFSTCKLGRKMTVDYFTQDHDTNMALARAVMLPNDVAILSEENSETMRSLLSYGHVRSHGGAINLVEKGQEERGSAEQGTTMIGRFSEIHPEIFMEGWIVCLIKLDILEDNPAWSKAVPALELSAPLTPYSPILLPDFDEEEYVNQPKKGEDGGDVPTTAAVLPVEVTTQSVEGATQPLKDAERTTTEEAGVDAVLNPLLSLDCFVLL
ncbi:hypothetical protein Acr_17g0010440 [Actinidia rufa]|uniref:Uncharacterized protein n=1 Tax=Actinidia rufa TaxID=165716 RepID=A0A7J0G3Y3_9ERIC|nr:hypothetical protein Acr_17g0010440 [Actinidia rufa]